MNSELFHYVSITQIHLDTATHACNLGSSLVPVVYLGGNRRSIFPKSPSHFGGFEDNSESKT